MDYQRKIDFAIKLLRSIPKDGPVEVAYSGGKDSDVILELAKMSGIDYRAIYKNTSIDPPGTLKHCREMGAEIIAPKMRFEDILATHGYPNRFRRFCCSTLKEYKVLDRAILGIRREESIKRVARYKEPEVCRLYPHKEKVRQYLPILEWTLEDVDRFIGERGIRCAPVYYDAEGRFHPERRLGCLCCPLMSRHARLLDFSRYPNMLKLYLRGGQRWFRDKPWLKQAQEYKGDVYEYLFCELFFDTSAVYRSYCESPLFPDSRVDAKRYMEGYFGIDLTLEEEK